MRILCFGDSNTWGYDPTNGLRYEKHQRYTGILQELMKEDDIIEEGSNGRTFVLHDPYCDLANGKDVLPYLLKSHMPLDIVVIMLGTNDLKRQFHLCSEMIARGAKTLIRMIKDPYANEKYPIPDILLVSPIHLHEDIWKMDGSMLDYGKEEYENSTQLAKYLEEVAETYDCAFLDAARYAKASKVDGMHMDIDQHKQLAQAMACKLEEMKIKRRTK